VSLARRPDNHDHSSIEPADRETSLLAIVLAIILDRHVIAGKYLIATRKIKRSLRQGLSPLGPIKDNRYYCYYKN
jgi:hypothetical protein